MPRLPRYAKNIACLESLWDRDLEKRLSVDDVLRTVATINRIRYTHFTCNTEEELAYNLKLLRRRSGYRVLYLALHGYPGHVQLDSCDLSLDALADYFGRGFQGWIVHFGTCETIRATPEELQRFIDRTGVAMVVGYGASVEWLEATALDLLFLDWVQRYRDITAMWRRFTTRYADLVAMTKMTAVIRPSHRA